MYSYYIKLIFEIIKHNKKVVRQKLINNLNTKDEVLQLREEDII